MGNDKKNIQTESQVSDQANTEQKPKIHTFKYWADVVKWAINLIGSIFDYIKANPFPKKDDYQVI